MCYCDKGTILGVCAAGHIGSNHSLPLFSPISLVVWPFVPSFLRRSRRDRDLLAGSNLLGARSADPPPLSVGPGIDRHTHTQQHVTQSKILLVAAFPSNDSSRDDKKTRCSLLAAILSTDGWE